MMRTPTSIPARPDLRSRTQLETWSWPRMSAAPTVLVPVGSTEQHGPHLPLNTDTLIATAVAIQVAERCREAEPELDVLVAPAISYGASGEHQDFAGTISIGTEVLESVLVELVRSLSTWAGRIIFVNAHGGNLRSLGRAVPQLIYEGHRVSWVPCATADADAHAGHSETSMMLYLAPDLVDMTRSVKGNVSPLQDLLPTMIDGGVVRVSSSGVLGDPSTASAHDGEGILKAMVADAVTRIMDGQVDHFGRSHVARDDHRVAAF